MRIQFACYLCIILCGLCVAGCSMGGGTGGAGGSPVEEVEGDLQAPSMANGHDEARPSHSAARSESSPHPDWIDEVRERIHAVFAGMEGDFHRERLEMRLEAAERLASLPERTPLMEAELEEFRASFDESFGMWARDPLNPATRPAELNVRDFGAAGDGATDDAPAFARAVEAVRALGGAPSILRVPAGDYLLGVLSPTRALARASVHLDLSCLTNCAVVGEAPETTRVEFGVYGRTGISMERSLNCSLANIDLSWREAPFSQTFLERYDPADATAVVRHHPGTLRPDDPRFRRAKREQVCFLATREGRHIRRRGIGYPFFALKAEDLGGGRFRIWFDTKHEDIRRFTPLPGDVIVLPDRDSTKLTVRIDLASFCTFSGVWFRNSPAGTIAGRRCKSLSAVRCRVFPKSPDLALSSNADTFFCGRGAHLAHCEFRNMCDDGANCHSDGVPVIRREGPRTAVIRALAGRLRVGDFQTIVHAIDGRAGDFRVVSVRKFHEAPATTEGTAPVPEEFWAVEYDRDLPHDLVTQADVGDLDADTRWNVSHGLLKKVDAAPDLVFTPLEWGVGFTMRGCSIGDLRGCGLNVQCPHALVEGNVFENILVGMKMTGLTQWREGTPPCDVLLRGNVFRDCNVGVRSVFTTFGNGPSLEKPIRWVEIVSNRFERVDTPFSLSNAVDVTMLDNVEM